jgi:ABC-type cobalamin transport system permease subunit
MIHLGCPLEVIGNDLDLGDHRLLAEGGTGNLHNVGDNTLVAHVRVGKSLNPEWIMVEVHISGSIIKSNFNELRIVGKRRIAVQVLRHDGYYHISQSDD